MAREIRSSPRTRDFGRLAGVALLLSIAMVVLASITTERAAPGPLTGVGVLGILAWIVYQLVQHSKPYRCPECGDRLEKSFLSPGEPGDRKDGGPIHCVCPRCDVEWDTGRQWTHNAD